MKLFVAPHNDDAVLFGAFTLQRERPHVFTVFDSFLQVSRGHVACRAAVRQKEDIAATTILGCCIDFGHIPDDEPAQTVRDLLSKRLANWRHAAEVWLPAVQEDGHEQHNLVGEVGLQVFAGSKIHRYLTYTRILGKSTAGIRVDCTGSMVLKKLQSLACYRTQMEIDALGCWPHFLRDQNEYVLEDVE